MQKWTIGRLTVYSVSEAVIPTAPSQLLRGVPDDLSASGLTWLSPHYVDGSGNLRVAIQSFFVESDDDLVVVDSCFGEGHDLPYRLPIDPDQYRQSLAAAGFSPADVTAVVSTHLHLDHAGRNTTYGPDRWTPTYPNATYLVTEAEFQHWRHSVDANRAAPESVEPLSDHGVLRLVAMDHRVTENISLVPTPGHTPGHVSVRIESAGSVAVISGDVAHHPLQIAHPDTESVPDTDPAASRVTRRRLLADIHDEQAILLGTHFAEPSGGRVLRETDRWVWAPV